MRGHALQQHGASHVGVNIIRDGDHAVAVNTDLLGIRTKGVVPRHHGAFGDFTLGVRNHAADSLKANGERGLGIINALPVVGINVIDARCDDVY